MNGCFMIGPFVLSDEITGFILYPVIIASISPHFCMKNKYVSKLTDSDSRKIQEVLLQRS